MESQLEMLEGVEEEMMSRSFLFNDPVSYREGVGATTQAVRVMLSRNDSFAHRAHKSAQES